ncbi:hypothetical protein GPALN_010381 [Globodera pallida]|nr:hypothetical protein GPALN_010381 [Globodera pallida]
MKQPQMIINMKMEQFDCDQRRKNKFVNGQLIRNEARSQQIRNRAGNLRNMQVSIINGQLIINGRHISAEQWNLGDLRRSNIVVTNGHVTINGRHLPQEAWTNGEQSAQNVPRATWYSINIGCVIQ